MRWADACDSIAAPDVTNPLSENRTVDQAFPPENPGYPWMLLDQVVQAAMLDQSDQAGRHRCEIVIHLFEEKALQIRHIAPDMD
jgi:hypothetical protein